MTNLRHIAALVLSAATLVACGDSGQTNITAPAPSAQVLFFNEGLNAPGVNFYADTMKLTATASSSGAPSPVGTTYGQVAAGGYYTGLTPGQYTLSGRISDTTAGVANTVISSVAQTIAAGKAYSYYQSGPYDATAKKVDAWVVEDPIPATYDYSVGNVRFVNAIYNSTPGTVTLVNNDTTLHPTPPPVVLGSAVAYKTAGAFTKVPPGTYTVTVTGLDASGTTVAGSIAVAGGHYYTITARGDMTVTSSKATNVPKVDVVTNR